VVLPHECDRKLCPPRAMLARFNTFDERFVLRVGGKPRLLQRALEVSEPKPGLAAALLMFIFLMRA